MRLASVRTCGNVHRTCESDHSIPHPPFTNQMSSQLPKKTIAVDVLSSVQMRKWQIICHRVQLLSVKADDHLMQDD